MLTITRRLEFDAGHRLVGHESKCKHLHGHRYVAEVTLRTTAGVDGVGRVLDYGVIKERIGGWIDEHWDHNMILNPADSILKIASKVIFAGKAPFIMPPHTANPTAENMVRVLFHVSRDLLADVDGIEVVKMRLYETPNCWADFEG